MDGWNRYDGKKVFLRLKNGRVYSGIVQNINSDDYPIVFITIKDKFNFIVTIVTSEILEIKEEEVEDGEKH